MGDGDLSTLPAWCERKSVLGFGLGSGVDRASGRVGVVGDQRGPGNRQKLIATVNVNHDGTSA